MHSSCKALLFLSLCGVLAAASPSFKQALAFPTKAGPLASAIGDFNHDGHADIAIANTAVNSVSIVLGGGDGTFAPSVEYSTGTCQMGQMITGDFNRDGYLDLLGSCTLTDTIIVLPGKGDGSFGPPILSQAPLPVVSGFLDAFVEPLTSADVNGDGIPDLALIIQTSQSVGLTSTGAIGQAVIMTGNGDGTFGHVTMLDIAPAGAEPYALQLADVNGDGKMDIIGIAFDFNASGLTDPPAAFLIVAIGDGTGAFQLSHSYPLTNIPQTGMMLADVNADGKTDVVFAGLSIAAILNSDVTDFSGVGVFLGQGDGSFTESYSVVDSQATFNQATIGSALAPVLGGKNPDLIGLMFSDDLAGVNPPTGTVVVRPNNGDGTFGPPQIVVGPSAALPFSLAVADFNSDGRPDCVVFDFDVNLLNLLFSNTAVLNQIDTIGQSIATFPTATAAILLNTTPVTTFTNTNAGSFQPGSLATSSIVSAFGAGLTASVASASSFPLPTNLAGASVAVTDSLGVTRNAPMFYASPTQINYAIPDGTAMNTAAISITTPSGIVTVQQSIVLVAPGVFGASGIAAAQVFTYNGTATPVVTSTLASNGQGQFVAAPIDVGSGSTTVFLILYGTGLRNHQQPVTATIGSATLTAAFAGPQGTFVGEDQINVQLPQSLKGAGLVNVTLNVDGQTANPVQILIQ